MERYTEKIDGLWTVLCEYGDLPCPVVTQDVIDLLAAYEDTGLSPEEIQKLKAEAANGQQMKNLLSRNGFRDLSEAQAWIEQMKKLESNIEYYGFLDIIEAFPTLTPPNEPLTLEELREMDGEPVWIVEHPDWGHWELSADAEDYIADRDQDLYGLKHDDPAGQCGLHVLGWLAYRRPPEGEV